MTHDQELNALRAEWRGTIKDIDGHVRRLDAGLNLDMLERHSGEAAQRWRLMLLAWRDELMDLLRDYPTAVTHLPKSTALHGEPACSMPLKAEPVAAHPLA